MHFLQSFADNNGFQSVSNDYEVGIDPAASMIFSTDYQKWVPAKFLSLSVSNAILCIVRRNDEVIKMLDSSKDNLKLMAMRRIINVRHFHAKYLTLLINRTFTFSLVFRWLPGARSVQFSFPLSLRMSFPKIQRLETLLHFYPII